MKSKHDQLVFFLAMLIISPSAFAYLDPGTGSLLLQLLLGGAAGLITIAKLYWHQLRSLLVKVRVVDSDELEPSSKKNINSDNNANE